MDINDVRSVWTVCMLFMFAGMLGLIFQFGLGAMPLVIVLTTILAFIKLIRRTSFQLRQSAAARDRKVHLKG
jgi:hypothetical protein